MLVEFRPEEKERKIESKRKKEERRVEVATGGGARTALVVCFLAVLMCSPSQTQAPTISTRNPVLLNLARQAMLIEHSLKTAILTSKINALCCSLTLARQEEPKGRSRASSAKLLRFRSQSLPMAAPRPSCWCSRSELPRVRKGSLKTKAIYLLLLPPAILWVWPGEEGESIRPTLGISGFLSKFTSSCARTRGLSGLPSRAASPGGASQGGWWLHAWNVTSK